MDATMEKEGPTPADDSIKVEKTNMRKARTIGKSSNKKSIVWKNFIMLEDCDPQWPRAKCYYCGIDYACHPVRNGTRAMLNHLNQCKKNPNKQTGKGQKTLSYQPNNDFEGGGGNLVATNYSAEACRKALAYWDNSKTLVRFLKLFYNATLRFSGSLHATSNHFFHEFFIIQNKLHQLCCSSNFLLHSMAKSMKSKCDKYWGSMGNMNLLLVIAIVLDPRYKLRYVEFCFEKLYLSPIANELTSKVKDTLGRLYDWYYTHDSSQSVQAHSSGQPSEEMDVENEDEDAHNLITSQWKMHLKEVGSTMSNSELDKFLDENCEEGGDKFDVLGWWKINITKYPVLSQVAHDVLAIPISTVASESTFSTSGRILDPFRSSLSPLTVEALVCTQNWLKTSTNIPDALEDVEEYEKIEIEALGTKGASSSAPLSLND